MEYRMNHRVRYSEVCADHFVSIAQIINYFQDCSTFQSEDIGYGISVQEKKEKAWLLVSWQVIVDRFPAFGETLSIGTWAYDWKKIYGYRNFDIKDQDGVRIAYASSTWIYTDTRTMLPARPTTDEIAAYGTEPRIDMDYAPRKIRLPKEYEERNPFPIIKAHIDTNHHVNNAQYIGLAEEFLPSGYRIHQVRAEYKHAAVLHDMIYPRVSSDTDRQVIQLCDQEGTPYVVVEFKEREQEQIL